MNILITGCSTGIGLVTAKLLAEKGHSVFAAVRKTADAEALKNFGAIPVIMDLNDSESIKTAVAEIADKTQKKLDALINNAGFIIPGAVEDLSRDNLRLQFETNLFGLQELTNAIIPWMRAQGHGRIVNLSSILGLISMPFRGAYCASKHALEGLTKAMRMELAPANIQVILIQPGPIKSAFRSNATEAYRRYLNIENSPFKNQYESMLTGLEKHKDEKMFTLPPEAVAKKILHAVSATKPKVNYYVTVPAYSMMILNRLLPARWLDKILVRASSYESK